MDFKEFTAKDLKKLDISQLSSLAQNLREEIISAVNLNGGHLSSNLGIVETTIALHYVFDFPLDKVIFDVGHQCYTHKILSGRTIEKIRKQGGVSGFPDPEESEYDVFGTGHAGTSLAFAIGLADARDREKKDFFVISVVGDGALFNGENLEALTSRENKPSKMIVVLNDNGMSISKNINGFYKKISKKTISKSYVRSKSFFHKIFGNSFITRILSKLKNFIKRLFGSKPIFEDMGFKYVGVLDGNNIKDLVKTFTKIKNSPSIGPILLHVKTTKGKGYKQAEERAEEYHGVSENLALNSSGFSKELGKILIKEIEKDKRIIAITAAMKEGTGLKDVEKVFPDNVIDVGIAESYALTYSAGLAKGGQKPIVCMYSTFLQRAYDQIIEDVCMQNLPVVFCVDRAGFSGADGKTHQGVYDLSFLTHIPSLTVLAPAYIQEFSNAVSYALSLNSPVAIRYPKGGVECEGEVSDFSHGWQKISGGKDAIILAVGGNMINLAQEIQSKAPFSVGIISARIVKPLDFKVLEEIKEKTVITLEENSVLGGLGSSVLGYYSKMGHKTKVKVFGVPDCFLKHDTIKNQIKTAGLTAEKIISEVFS